MARKSETSGPAPHLFKVAELLVAPEALEVVEGVDVVEGVAVVRL